MVRAKFLVVIVLDADAFEISIKHVCINDNDTRADKNFARF